MNSILGALHIPPVQTLDPEAPALRLALAFLLDGCLTVRDRCPGSMAEVLDAFERELDPNEWPELEPDTAGLIERVHDQLEAWTGVLVAASQ